MTETTMPATEATIVRDEQELICYELAYHILPTVAEGEVTKTTDELKKLIQKAGGTGTDEEVALRFELAYEIDKYLEGKYRKFTSAYFGWIRFTLTTANLAGLTEGVDEHKQLLRYLLVRLTKVEEASPFRFHEAIESTKVRTVDLDEVDLIEDTDALVVESEVNTVPLVVAGETK
jgi:ribosomal protein S6